MEKQESGTPREGSFIRLVVFALDEQRYALHLAAVERILPLVEVTPLPKAPEIVLGVVNVHGAVVPVVNMRRRFRLPEIDGNPAHRLILAQTARRRVALVVDSSEGVIETNRNGVTGSEEILPRLEYVEGVVKLPDGLILIHDLDRFLSLDEERELERILAARDQK
jgi:purine-binding chemotaxis protein CheW